MIPSARPRHRYTYAEYLAYERDSQLKHEYDDGEILAMAGGSRRHSVLAARVTAALENARKAGCLTFQSDQRLRVVATGRATYPDVSVVCGPIQGDPADPDSSTITNPVMIVEVLAPSTEQDDRGAKWMHYQRIPSLQEYVLVSQGEARIERYRRLPEDGWAYQEVSAGEIVLVTGAVIDLVKLYDELPV